MHSRLVAALLAGMFFSAAVSAEDSTSQIAAAKGPYFLVDPRVIEDRWLVERFVVPPVRHTENPLFVAQHAWEGTGPHAGGSVLRDPQTGQFLMWYSVFNPDAYQNRKPFSYNVCLAESDDGLSWNRPHLGIFDYAGSTDNNVIRLGKDKTQNIDVCLNPRPDRWPGRFLAIHNQRGGVFVSSSEDGRTFTPLFDTAAISYHSDTHNNFVYDDVRNEWLLYCRPRAWAGYHRRRVALQTSSDLENWSHERTILIPTETEIPEYYGLTVFRRGDLFFGILQIYNNDAGLMHGELIWSGDGVHWEMLPTHPPFLTLGPENSWDAGMVHPFESPVDVGDETRFYYGGFRNNHHTLENTSGIGLMTAERDRLAGVRPNSSEPGLIMTRPLVPGGRQLRINAVIRGRVTAELRTDGNRPIPGFTFDDAIPVTESGFAQTVAWKSGGLDRAPEEFVRILFRLDDAELFTFDLQDRTQ
ncbi:MAG: hypothetical protein KF861_07210 [Planctomycetaceae bacterium]|nr:hypothetical protein [Planctomycetaceae bacterium]